MDERGKERGLRGRDLVEGKEPVRHRHTHTHRTEDESAAVKSFPSPPKSC